MLVEGDDLAVEHRLAGAERSADATQLRIGDGDVVAVAGDQLEASWL
jgi:hypothetical protein